ncbi:MAG: hypothetical protein AAF390_09080 [Pseudomonadota bacterium]
MAGIDQPTSPRDNNISRTKVDARTPHNSATARTADGDVAERRVEESSSKMKWLWVALAVLAGLVLLLWLFGGAEETAVTTTTTTDDAVVEDTATAPVAVESVEETSAGTTLIETDADVTTVPVVPVDE